MTVFVTSWQKAGQTHFFLLIHLMIEERVYSRVGLLGNPSDGFNGCCISFSLANFFAEVSLTPSEKLSFISHPQLDNLEFKSINQFHGKVAATF
jgi:hypothetical protein